MVRSGGLNKRDICGADSSNNYCRRGEKQDRTRRGALTYVSRSVPMEDCWDFSRLICQSNALDLATIAEPKLHRPGRARRRIYREKFAKHPIQNCAHSITSSAR